MRPLARWLALTMALVFVLAACGTSAAPTATPSPAKAVPTPTQVAVTSPTPGTTASSPHMTQAAQTSYSPEKVKELLANGFYLGGMQYAPGEEPQIGGTLTVSNRGDLPGADPMLSSGISSNNILSSIHGEGSLLRPKRSNIFEPEAHIAESWTSNEDSTIWTFKLRKDVKWHDGTGLVAEDLKWWIDLAYFPPTGRRTAYIGTFGPLKEVQAPDAYTLKLIMKQSAPHVLAEIMNNAAAPTHPRHLLKPLADAGNVLVSMQDANWVSVGPYKVDSYQKGSSFKSVRFDQYYEVDAKGRRMPYLDAVFYPFIPDRTVAVSAFRAGRIDGTSRGTGHHLTPDLVDGIKRSLGNKAWFMRLSYLSWGAGLQATKPPFNDQRVRTAIHLYSDRDQWTQLVYGGYGLVGTTMVPGSSWSNPDYVNWPGFNPKTKAQDQAEAKRLMKEAGVEGMPINVICRDVYIPNCEFMELTLRGLGFVPKLDIMDINRQTTLLQAGNFQLDMRPGGTGNPSTLLTAFVTTNPLNTHKHGDVQVDKYHELIQTTIDPTMRQKLTWEADKYITVDKAWYPHWGWEEAVVAYRTYVKGMWIPGEQVQNNNDMSEVWIDKKVRSAA